MANLTILDLVKMKRAAFGAFVTSNYQSLDRATRIQLQIYTVARDNCKYLQERIEHQPPTDAERVVIEEFCGLSANENVKRWPSMKKAMGLKY